MKKTIKLSLLLLLSGWILGLQAQDDDFNLEDDVQAIAAYDLKDCIQFAFKYSENYKKARLEIRNAKADVGTNIARGLPRIDAGISYQDNFKIPRQFVPAFLFDPSIFIQLR